ncbi:N-acetylmuramoyl-L-alanine amidase family protein, partial [Paenibacillus borealis]|uniref:N-acetylmuramoyl-L-alanine amidase family protein n=1 Tax=Paenibacillus borealis TaxID=160799 RepID=UPI0005A92D62
MEKVVIDAGHGGHDPGASANGLVEKDLTLKIALGIENHLRSIQPEVDIRQTRTDDTFVTLEDRANIANTGFPNFFVSVHINSGGGAGYEDYIHPDYPDIEFAEKYQTVFHDEMMIFLSTANVTDRGKKKKDLQVLRETNIANILTENLFIDDPNDSVLLKTETFIDGLCQAHAHAIKKVLELLQ